MNSKIDRIPDKWLYFPIALMLFYFIWRIVDQSQMIKVFPLDVTNDYGAHMAQLYFLAKYGFHSVVPNWYNGFVLFLFYPPGWYFFALPFYLLTKNLTLATFLSVLALFCGSFLAIYIFGKKEKFSFAKITILFLFFFANPVSIGNYIRLGRVSELFALTNFIILSALLLYYKDRVLGKSFFLLFVPFYTFIIIGHPSTAIFFHVVLLGFFIVKTWRERVYTAFASLVGIALSSFWWFPFITSLSSELTRSDFPVAERLLDLTGFWAWEALGTFVVVPIFLAAFYFYWRSSNRPMREFLFFSPLLLASLLVLTRLVIFIPLLVRVYPDVYMLFFIFFATYFLLKVRIAVLPKVVKYSILIVLIVGPIASVAISELHTSYFVGYTSLEEEAISILQYAQGRFYMPSSPKFESYSTSHPPMYYAYGAVYFNLYSVGGANNFGTMTNDYLQRIRDMQSAVEAKDCEGLLASMEMLNTTDLIVFDDDCKTLALCSYLDEVITKKRTCLYRLNEL